MKAKTPIRGLRVIIVSNEFVDANQLASVEEIEPENQTLLLRLTNPLHEKGRCFAYAVAKPRLERDHITDLPSGKPLSCAVTWIPMERFNSTDPFDLSWWRGGAAAVADIKVE